MDVQIVDKQTGIEYEFFPTNIVLGEKEVTLNFIDIDEQNNRKKHKPLFDFVSILFSYCQSPNPWQVMISSSRFKFVVNDFSIEKIPGYYTDMNLHLKGYYLN